MKSVRKIGYFAALKRSGFAPEFSGLEPDGSGSAP
jgi:hypothetical protein